MNSNEIPSLLLSAVIHFRGSGHKSKKNLPDVNLMYLSFSHFLVYLGCLFLLFVCLFFTSLPGRPIVHRANINLCVKGSTLVMGADSVATARRQIAVLR